MPASIRQRARAECAIREGRADHAHLAVELHKGLRRSVTGSVGQPLADEPHPVYSFAITPNMTAQPDRLNNTGTTEARFVIVQFKRETPATDISK